MDLDKKSLVVLVTLVVPAIFYIVDMRTEFTKDISKIEQDLGNIKSYRDISMNENDRKAMIIRTNQEFIQIKNNIDDSIKKLKAQETEMQIALKLDMQTMINNAETQLNQVTKKIAFQKKNLKKINSDIKTFLKTKEKLAKDIQLMNNNVTDMEKYLNKAKSISTPISSPQIINSSKSNYTSKETNQQYAIQYVVSSNQEKILGIRDQLKEENFSAFIEQHLNGTFKIKIGYFSSRSNAVKELERIRKVFSSSRNAKEAFIISL